MNLLWKGAYQGIGKDTWIFRTFEKFENRFDLLLVELMPISCKWLQSEFWFVFDEDAIVVFDGPLHHVVEEVIFDKTRRGHQNAAGNIKVDVAQNGLQYVVIKLL